MKAILTTSVSDMYNTVLGQAPLIDALFRKLRKKIDMELKFQAQVAKAMGALTMLLATNASSLYPGHGTALSL